MDFDDVWVNPTEKLENKGKRESSPNPLQSIQPISSNSLPSLKKIQLLPLANESSASSLPVLEVVSPLPPATNIKPPPALFPDLWGESDASFSEPDEVSQANILNPNQTEEHLCPPASADPLCVFEGTSQTIVSSEAEAIVDGWWESEDSASEEASEDITAYALASSDVPNIEDLDLFDIDAVLAKQEAEIQQQAYEQGRKKVLSESRFERWGGALSLIHVNWDDPETAEQDALTRLGYTNIALSEETRAFIIQAARNARLPHKQEILLTTHLAEVRARLASLPPIKKDTIDLYAVRRQALQAEITEIEQTLTLKMQWVAIKKAAQFLGKGIELDDLIQFGMEGVIAGIQHFDITRKARLLLAVNMWTFQALTRAIADHGSAIRLPAYLFEQAHAFKKQRHQWQTLQEECRLTDEELARAMNISPAQLKAILEAEEVLRASKNVYSLERSALDEDANDGYSFKIPEIDFTTGGDLFLALFEEIDGRQIQHILFQYLTPREQQVLSLRAGLDENGDGEKHTLEEIGQILGVTRERVRQIEERARKKLIGRWQRMSSELPVLQKAERAKKTAPGDKNSHQKKRITSYTKQGIKQYSERKAVKSTKQTKSNTKLKVDNIITRGDRLKQENDAVRQAKQYLKEEESGKEDAIAEHILSTMMNAATNQVVE